jgi:hypothetical protein
MQVRARIQTGARWATGSRVGPVIGKEDAPARQGIEAWGLQDGMTKGGQAIPPPLIDGDEEHVAVWGHALTLAQPGRWSYVSR